MELSRRKRRLKSNLKEFAQKILKQTIYYLIKEEKLSCKIFSINSFAKQFVINLLEGWNDKVIYFREFLAYKSSKTVGIYNKTSIASILNKNSLNILKERNNEYIQCEVYSQCCVSKLVEILDGALRIFKRRR